MKIIQFTGTIFFHISNDCEWLWCYFSSGPKLKTFEQKPSISRFWSETGGFLSFRLGQIVGLKLPMNELLITSTIFWNDGSHSRCKRIQNCINSGVHLWKSGCMIRMRNKMQFLQNRLGVYDAYCSDWGKRKSKESSYLFKAHRLATKGQ